MTSFPVSFLYMAVNVSNCEEEEHDIIEIVAMVRNWYADISTLCSRFVCEFLSK